MVMLSVCITTHNTEKDIGAALESVFSQKTQYPFEVLVGDDGSTDGTLEIISSWEKKHPDQMRLVSWTEEERAAQEQRDFIARASRNRLHLLAEAKGKYVTFLDGDDLYADTEFYEKAISILEQEAYQDCFICGGRTVMLFPDGKMQYLQMSPWKPGRLVAQEYWAHQYTHAEACILRNQLDFASLPETYLDTFDDNCIVLAAVRQGDFYGLPDAAVLYRQHPGGYATRPVGEQVLLQAIGMDFELEVVPEWKEAVLQRHPNERGYLEAFGDEVTAARYPLAYERAKHFKAKNILKLFHDVALRRHQRKIRVVFLCYRPQLWIGVKSIYEAMMQDPAFEVIIMAIPVKTVPHGQVEYVSEGAEAFFQGFDCQVINGYVREKNAWIDLHSLHPDYVFYLHPYNWIMPSCYSTHLVSQYADICFVPYGISVISGDVEDISFNADFFSDLTYLFADVPSLRQWMMDHGHCQGRLKPENILFWNYTRFDHLNQYRGKESPSWHLGREAFRVLWLPRWSTGGGSCNFFRYKDKVLEYADAHPEDIELLFRPHPQMWEEFIRSDEMPEAEQEAYQAEYDRRHNAFIDSQKEYMQTLFASDALVADETSMLAEYYLTGKPIIYCHNEQDHFTELGAQLAQGYYIANNWEEVEAYLEMLRHGFDPLRSRRKKIQQEVLPVSDGMSAGEHIRDFLKERFLEADRVVEKELS